MEQVAAMRRGKKQQRNFCWRS